MLARKSILRFWALLLLGAILVVAGDRLVGHFLERSYRNATHGIAGKENYVVDSVRADIVVMGSSRALHHYVPSLITQATGLSCYNCGIANEGIANHYAMLEAIAARHLPRLVIYEVTYNYDIEGAYYMRRWSRVKRLPQEVTCRDSILLEGDPLQRYKMLSRIYPYNTVAIDNWVSPPDKEIYDADGIDHGYVPLHGTYNPSPDFTYDEVLSGGTDPFKMKWLRALVSHYRDRLVVFCSPHYGATTATDSLYNPVKTLCAKYGVPCHILRSDTLFNHTASLWDDDGHLNHDGATLYTSERVIPLLKKRLSHEQ